MHYTVGCLLLLAVSYVEWSKSENGVGVGESAQYCSQYVSYNPALVVNIVPFTNHTPLIHYRKEYQRGINAMPDILLTFVTKTTKTMCWNPKSYKIYNLVSGWTVPCLKNEKKKRKKNKWNLIIDHKLLNKQYCFPDSYTQVKIALKWEASAFSDDIKTNSRMPFIPDRIKLQSSSENE